jgi:transposase
MRSTMTPLLRQAVRREVLRQGEPGGSARKARECLTVPMHRTTVYRLLKRVQSEGERALADGRHGHPVKIRGEVLTVLMEYSQATLAFPVLLFNTSCKSASVSPSVSVNSIVCGPAWG